MSARKGRPDCFHCRGTPLGGLRSARTILIRVAMTGFRPELLYGGRDCVRLLIGVRGRILRTQLGEGATALCALVALAAMQDVDRRQAGKG